MSRVSASLSIFTHIYSGNDHMLGFFFDVTDDRFAGSKEDEQGEGYLLEWSTTFGFSTNLIEATEEDLKSTTRLMFLAEQFLGKKGLL